MLSCPTSFGSGDAEDREGQADIVLDEPVEFVVKRLGTIDNVVLGAVHVEFPLDCESLDVSDGLAFDVARNISFDELDRNVVIHSFAIHRQRGLE